MSPWLAALYVIPAARRRGVGAALIEAALARAAQFAAGTIYLLTTDQEAYYARLGLESPDTQRRGHVDDADAPPNALGPSTRVSVQSSTSARCAKRHCPASRRQRSW